MLSNESYFPFIYLDSNTTDKHFSILSNRPFCYIKSKCNCTVKCERQFDNGLKWGIYIHPKSRYRVINEKNLNNYHEKVSKCLCQLNNITSEVFINGNKSIASDNNAFKCEKIVILT